MISTVTFFAPALSPTHFATHFASSDVAAKAGLASTTAKAADARKSFIDSTSLLRHAKMPFVLGEGNPGPRFIVKRGKESRKRARIPDTTNASRTFFWLQ